LAATASSKRVTDARGADLDLAARCQRGDVDAFERLYRDHSGRLYNLAYRMSGTAADAEELVQEMFLLAHRKLATFKGESSIGTWLYRLGANLCVDHLRSSQHRKGQATESLDDDRDRGARLPASPTNEMTLTRLALERAIAELPASYRAAFVLHDIEGFGHGEVGEILGIAEGTSKSLVHKARMRLRQYLTGLGG
jgi:RNA polymerase sigma-70 factor, ECF subfamily